MDSTNSKTPFAPWATLVIALGAMGCLPTDVPQAGAVITTNNVALRDSSVRLTYQSQQRQPAWAEAQVRTWETAPVGGRLWDEVNLGNRRMWSFKSPPTDPIWSADVALGNSILQIQSGLLWTELRGGGLWMDSSTQALWLRSLNNARNHSIGVAFQIMNMPSQGITVLRSVRPGEFAIHVRADSLIEIQGQNWILQSFTTVNYGKPMTLQFAVADSFGVLSINGTAMLALRLQNPDQFQLDSLRVNPNSGAFWLQALRVDDVLP